MADYWRWALTGLIIILLFACFKRQHRYWREMQTSRPTGSLRAGYFLAIVTVCISLPFAIFTNTPSNWQLFVSILLMTVVFCVKITFSPAVIASVLAISLVHLHVDGTFPFFEIWSAAATVIAWRLPEEIRVVYATLTFVWAMTILIGGRSADAEAASSLDVVEATDVVPY